MLNGENTTDRCSITEALLTIAAEIRSLTHATENIGYSIEGVEDKIVDATNILESVGGVK